MQDFEERCPEKLQPPLFTWLWWDFGLLSCVIVAIFFPIALQGVFHVTLAGWLKWLSLLLQLACATPALS